MNDEVSVKLTKEGVQVYNKHKNKYGLKESFVESKNWLDKYHKSEYGNHYKFQLWDLMSIFGSEIYMGGPNLFGLEIIIEEIDDKSENTKLKNELTKYMAAMDSLYNFNEASRAAVIQCFGSLHSQEALKLVKKE